MSEVQDQVKQLGIPKDGKVQLLQITDCHLFADKSQSLLGINTQDSFEAVLADVLDKQDLAWDAVLATGDLSQDASDSAYCRLSDGLRSLDAPCFHIPGNHDLPAQMQASIKGRHIAHEKRILAGNWQIILLDSSVKRQVHGQLSEAELAMLDAALFEYPDRHALVVLHHQPVPIGSEWLDNICLKESELFWQVVDRHPNVQGILWGHVHQDFEAEKNDIKLMSTPSTCVQFKCNSDDFAAGDEAPGYRTLTLNPDGSLDTKVYRIRNNQFKVDHSLSGY